MAKRKVDTKEIGLLAGLRFTDHFLKTDYLHYGLWRDLEIDVSNLKQAQRAYTQFLFSFIPDGVRTILDVGCGSGRVAHELLERGYEVDCISPSEKLTAAAKELLGDRARIHQVTFEEAALQSEYDLVLFAESFQYIGMEHSLPKAKALLADGGRILISDFFQRDNVEGQSPIGGGHNYADFRRRLSENRLQIVHEEDITDLVAPTSDILNRAMIDVVLPLYHDVRDYLADRFPFMNRIITGAYNSKLKKLEAKHFQGHRSGASFAKYKKYVTILLDPNSRAGSTPG